MIRIIRQGTGAARRSDRCGRPGQTTTGEQLPLRLRDLEHTDVEEGRAH